MTTLYHPARPVNRNRTFGQGVFAQRPEKLPLGPDPREAQWWAGQNADADASDSEWADEFEKRTLSRTEYRSLQTAEAMGRYEAREAEIFAKYDHAREAEVAETCGAQVGHDAAPEATPVADESPAEVRALDWAYAILGGLKSVATADQIRYARYILCDDWLVGKSITPVGPSLDALEAMLPPPAPAPPEASKPARRPRPVTLHQVSKAKRLGKEAAR